MRKTTVTIGKTNLIDPTSLNITDQSVDAPDGIPVPETNNSTGGTGCVKR